MRSPGTVHIFALLLAIIWLCFVPRQLWADSLRFLTDLEYEVSNLVSTDKATAIKTTTERAEFSQIYNLEILKEIFPTLTLSAGGLFSQDSTRTKTDDIGGLNTDTRDTSIRPYVELLFDTPIIRGAAGYRKNEIKQSGFNPVTERLFNEEYTARLSWEPVELPEGDLDFSRAHTYDEPLNNDIQTDIYQFRSRYDYQDYNFNYNHTTNDSDNKITDFNTVTHSDNGTVRFSRGYLQGKVYLNSSLRVRRQQVNFTGTGARLVDSSAPGSIIGTLDDLSPDTSDPDINFSLSSVDLLVDLSAATRQFSFGLDFDLPTTLDTLLVEFDDVNGRSSTEFSWQVFVRDTETELWEEITPVQQNTNFAENRFEISFPEQTKRFIKIVTRQIVVDNEDLIIRELRAQRTLPADTSEFISTDWTADMAVNWRMTDKTSSGFDLLYREERSKPFDDKRTVLNSGARIRHQFNDIFVGSMQGRRSEVRERGGSGSTGHSLSASLAANYLETFDQSLTYSISHLHDNEEGSSISNALFLRSNLDLYPGWSMYLDNGFSWQNPATGADNKTTFTRISSNLEPNRWMNFTLTYGVSWSDEEGKPVTREQNGRLVATWVPLKSLSLSADLSYTDETGEVKDSTSDQLYFINWSPFRNGTLQFSLAYGQSQDDEDEKIWTLSPTLRWQINRNTLLTLEYSVGERDDRIEVVEFENYSAALRFFY